MKRKLITLIGTLLIGFLLVTAQAIAEMPADVLAQIKAKAAKDFPDDYNTQKYVIDTQRSAYVQVKNYSAQGVPSDVLEKIMHKAERDFPNDYSTQKYVIDTQVVAYKSMK